MTELSKMLERVKARLAEPIFTAVTAPELIDLMIEEAGKGAASEFVEWSKTKEFDPPHEQPILKHIAARCLEQDSKGRWGLKTKKGWLFGHNLRTFNDLWGAFSYKHGMRPAAKAFLADVNYIQQNIEHILYAARQTALERKPGGVTPKMLEGWISDRLNENHLPEMKVKELSDWNEDDWRNLLGDVNAKWKPDHLKNNWNTATMPGPNPWGQFNPKIPEAIRAEYSAWNWEPEGGR